MTGYKSKRAAAQDKLTQPEQEPVAWLEPEWGEKICPEVGYEVTMTDDHPKDLGWTPLYPHPPQGEIVAYLVLFEGAGKLLEFTKGNYIHGAKVKHIPLYTAPPQPAQERNFCPRCGKRTADLTVIHTCTPPQEKNT